MWTTGLVSKWDKLLVNVSVFYPKRVDHGEWVIVV